MNGFLRKAMVLALAGSMTLGMNATVFAADDVKRDDTSKFTENGTTASTGTSEFYLIKDYDSMNPTGDTAPKSSSPTETFTYVITPYAVWNAGSTYDDATGVATKITKDNMPMLTLNDGSGVEGTEANRRLTVTQAVETGDAKYENGNNDTENTGDKKTAIKLPTYDTVGDYWYKVVETNGKTTGVLYGTNSNATSGNAGDIAAANGNYSSTYYIHVQVTETGTGTTAGTPALVSNVTMHKSAPDASKTNAEYNNTYAQTEGKDSLYKQDNKVNAIENQYYAGELVVKKEVTGNAGDKNEYFQVTVKFTKPAGTIVNSDIPFTAVKKTDDNKYTSTDFVIKGQNSTASITNKTVINWEDNSNPSVLTAEKTATCTFWVKDGTTVTFSNIPYGINYRIEETQPSDDTYSHKFSFGEEGSSTADSKDPQFNGKTLTSDVVTGESDNGETSSGKWNAAYAQGSITDINDTVTITNKKDSVIDIGVITSNAPYIAVLIFAGAALVLYTRRRRDMFEE